MLAGRSARTCRDGKSPSAARAITDLPEPDSPTTHSDLVAHQVRLDACRPRAARSARAGRSMREAIDRRAPAWYSSRPARRSAARSCRSASRGLSASFRPSPTRLMRHHREQDRDPRDRAQPPRAAQHRPPGTDHEAPAHHVGVAQTQERQRRLDQDRRGHDERAGHDDGGQTCSAGCARKITRPSAHAADRRTPARIRARAWPGTRPAPDARSVGQFTTAIAKTMLRDRWRQNRDEEDGEQERRDRLKELRRSACSRLSIRPP